MISGYIICLPLAKRAHAAPERAPEFSYGRYMLRRVTRLEPPYLLVLTLSFAALTLIGALGLKFLTEGTSSYSAQSISLPASFAASTVYAHGLLFRSFPSLIPPAWSGNDKGDAPGYDEFRPSAKAFVRPGQRPYRNALGHRREYGLRPIAIWASRIPWAMPSAKIRLLRGRRPFSP